MIGCGKPPRMTHTPSAARSIVPAVGPRPTFCRSGTIEGIPAAILGRVRGLLTVLALAAVLAAGCGESKSERAPSGDRSLPAPGEPLSRSPKALAARVTQVSRDLRRSIDAWLAPRPARRAPRGRRARRRPRAAGPAPPPARGARPPRALQLRALYQQRASRRLARRPHLARATLRRLPRWLRAEARGEVAAMRDLFRLTRPSNERRFKTQAARAPGVLRGFYRTAQRRFRVRWDVLAAVNLVESGFGRLRNDSSAGAQGPMQFIPSTWRVYGMGGDVHDPHDAILGAANYLRSSGAPRSYGRALYAYNNSPLYVDAVLHFARRMAADRRVYYALWSWQVFVRTRHGDVRLTAPP